MWSHNDSLIYLFRENELKIRLENILVQEKVIYWFSDLLSDQVQEKRVEQSVKEAFNDQVWNSFKMEEGIVASLILSGQCVSEGGLWHFPTYWQKWLNTLG